MAPSTNGSETPWVVFVWTVAIVTSLILGLIGLMASIRFDVSDLQTKVAVIQNDTAWIKQNIEQRSITRAP